jgi:hypothetical protein
MNDPDPQLIQRLIALGNAPDSDTTGIQVPASGAGWDKVSASLPIDDAMSLMRGLAILEKFGSVTPGVFVFRSLQPRMSQEQLQELLDFIFRHRKNIYLPFGFKLPDIASYQEYVQYGIEERKRRVRKEARQVEHQAEQSMREAVAADMRKLRKIAAEEHRQRRLKKQD